MLEQEQDDFNKESFVRRIKSDDKFKVSLMCDEEYYPWCPDKDEDWGLIASAPQDIDTLVKFAEEALEVIEWYADKNADSKVTEKARELLERWEGKKGEHEEKT